MTKTKLKQARKECDWFCVYNRFTYFHKYSNTSNITSTTALDHTSRQDQGSLTLTNFEPTRFLPVSNFSVSRVFFVNGIFFCEIAEGRRSALESVESTTRNANTPTTNSTAAASFGTSTALEDVISETCSADEKQHRTVRNRRRVGQQAEQY